jgi:hypothetical protein
MQKYQSRDGTPNLFPRRDPGRPSLAFFRDHLRTTRLENCTSLKEYLAQMYFWRDSLKHQGGEIDDLQFIEAILRGLTEDYWEHKLSFLPTEKDGFNTALHVDLLTSMLQGFERNLREFRRAAEERAAAEIARNPGAKAEILAKMKEDLNLGKRPPRIVPLGYNADRHFIAYWTYVAMCLLLDLVPVIRGDLESYHNLFNSASIFLGLLGLTFIFWRDKRLVLFLLQTWVYLIAVPTGLACFGLMRSCLLLSVSNLLLHLLIIVPLGLIESARLRSKID